MKTLYIDTSSSYLYLGIYVDENSFWEIKEFLGRDLSKDALVKVKELFDKASLVPNDIDRIIVINGPGSFTGIRVGLTIAKTFAWGLKKKIVTLSSLEAMAISSKDEGYDFIVPMIDARRKYVFAAIYDNQLNYVLPEQHISLEKLMEKVKEVTGKVLFVTNDTIDIDQVINSYDPKIKKIIHNCVNKKNVNPHGIDANYLKLTEAEENL